jgi:hypothetical protein
MFHDYLFPLAVTISLMIFLVQTLWNYDGWDDHVPKGAHSESCQSYALFSFFYLPKLCVFLVFFYLCKLLMMFLLSVPCLASWYMGYIQ